MLCTYTTNCIILKQSFIAGTNLCCRPSSVVGTATAYGLDGPGIESRWGLDFPWGPPNLPGGKVRPGREADPSPISSAEVKIRVELYLYYP